jgi:hypothetical protein
MTDETGMPLPPPVVTPQKSNPWLIAIVVIVVVCCGCFGVIGLLFGFWEPIRQAFGMSALLPVLTVMM